MGIRGEVYHLDILVWGSPLKKGQVKSTKRDWAGHVGRINPKNGRQSSLLGCLGTEGDDGAGREGVGETISICLGRSSGGF